jgi:predicted glycoside hydrolase/deacetylase ChbG (UPF0249 family)
MNNICMNAIHRPYFLLGFCLFLHLYTLGQEPIRLIIRSDDMGCSHATNEGIVKSYREGIATSIEIMVPAPWFPEAVTMLRDMPDVDVGVHLVLTSEWTNVKWRPLTDAPSLTDERGYFYPVIWPNEHFGEGRALLEHQPRLEEIERELRAQIELAKREIPQLSHLSAHMGCLNMSDETKALFRRLGEDYGLDVFPEDHNVQRVSGLGGAGLSPKQKVKNFIAALEALEPGNWLFVEHPSVDSPEQQAIGHPRYENVAYDRAGVLVVLTHPKVKAVIKKRGIELIGYDDLR